MLGFELSRLQKIHRGARYRDHKPRQTGQDEPRVQEKPGRMAGNPERVFLLSKKKREKDEQNRQRQGKEKKKFRSKPRLNEKRKKCDEPRRYEDEFGKIRGCQPLIAPCQKNEK